MKITGQTRPDVLPDRSNSIKELKELLKVTEKVISKVNQFLRLPFL